MSARRSFVRKVVYSRPAPALRADAALPWQGRGLVLVVDDEAPVRAVAERMLQQLGFETLAAGGGREAVERFRARHRELRFVLLDLVMPDIPGDAVLVAMRRIAPEVPVVVSSGFSEEDAMRRLADGKAVGFVPKPYRLEELAERLRALLEGERR